MAWKYLTVFVGSMFKFIFGPVTGEATGLSYWETCGFTIAGMMTSVIIFSLVGAEVKRQVTSRFAGRRRKSRLFTKNSRRIVGIWMRFGLPGVAFATPLLLSPIVGTILAVSFGEPPRRIVPAMLISALFWGLTLTWFFHMMGNQVFG